MAEITYKDLEKVNKEIKTTPIKGKEYAEVPQRVTAFRKLYPQGTITTELISLEGGVCVMKATVSDNSVVLGEGTAYEKESGSFINKTSYIENCETSAVGRALGFAGFGVDSSIASALEVVNAINNQEQTSFEKEKAQNEADSKAYQEQVEKKKAEVKALMEETNADVSAFLTFFTDKFERKITNVDMMFDKELDEALKMLKQKKADMSKTPKEQADVKGAVNV